jgi:hypothetical protein
MNKSETHAKILEIIHNVRPDIAPGEDNLFSTKVNCSPLDMVYMLLKIKETFNIAIDIDFVNKISDTTVDNITNAVMQALS